ncbi:MAG: TlyA family RNA methyltransferase [Clostridia bacterium]|nr:TlyA family RNA methyltransferase [Clostridia bacterium]
MSDVMRLDAALVARGIVGGRDKAKRLIADGQVSVNGRVVTKASVAVAPDDEVACAVRERFVGRGGEKLLKVLENTDLCVEGAVCADIGASTGGFTDCLLQHGAAKVYAIDVGHDQLAEVLRADDRVVCMEGVDVRHREAVTAQCPDGTLSLCTVDVSFISLTQIWEAIEPMLAESGTVVCLIKPQFEAGRAALSKRGVVRDRKDHIRVLQTLLRFWQERRFGVRYLSHSPILGGEGNIEYVAWLSRDTVAKASPEAVVQAAFAAWK